MLLKALHIPFVLGEYVAIFHVIPFALHSVSSASTDL